MSFVSRFIVLIESRRLHKAAVATVTAISILLSGFGMTAAHAAPGAGQAHKLAKDLQSALDAGQTPKARWPATAVVGAWCRWSSSATKPTRP